MKKSWLRNTPSLKWPRKGVCALTFVQRELAGDTPILLLCIVRGPPIGKKQNRTKINTGWGFCDRLPPLLAFCNYIFIWFTLCTRGKKKAFTTFIWFPALNFLCRKKGLGVKSFCGRKISVLILQQILNQNYIPLSTWKHETWILFSWFRRT